jgi:hypothetical protein
MTTPLLEAWQLLRSAQSGAQGDYAMQLVHAANDVRVFAALETARRSPGLLVDLPQEALVSRQRDLFCKVFSVTAAQFPGMPERRIGVLTILRDLEYLDIFAVFAGDILAAIADAGDARMSVAAMNRVIERWRHFMERRRASMTDERVRGLIGELVVLSRLLSSGRAHDSLTAWTGPHDAIHDFELPDRSVEVKSFQSEDGPTVRISDPRQMDVVRARPVHLVAVQLARSSSQGQTLPQLIALVNGVVAGAPGASELLDKKLAEYGYLPIHASLYTEPYAIERVLGFTVDEGFPRIRSDDVPAGVSEVQFSISLPALAPFVTDTRQILGADASVLE